MSRSKPSSVRLPSSVAALVERMLSARYAPVQVAADKLSRNREN